MAKCWRQRKSQSKWETKMITHDGTKNDRTSKQR